MGQKNFKMISHEAEPTTETVNVSRDDFIQIIENSITGISDSENVLKRDLRALARTAKQVAFGNWLMFPVTKDKLKKYYEWDSEDSEVVESIIGSLNPAERDDVCGCPLASVSEWLTTEAFNQSGLKELPTGYFFVSYDDQMQRKTGQTSGIATIVD